MARKPKYTRNYYRAKLTVGGLFEEHTPSKIELLRGIKRRCARLYDRVFDELDAIYRERAEFEYTLDGKERSDDERLVWIDFYTHQDEQRRAKSNTINKKEGYAYGGYIYCDKVYTGKVRFEKTRKYWLLKHQLDRLNRFGHYRQLLIEKEEEKMLCMA